jgi:hypothetical protein
MLPAEKLNQMWRDAVNTGDPTAGNAHIRFARAIEAQALKSQQQAINAAVMAERYACVDIANEWAVKYSQTGIASCTAGAAILRARTQPAPTTTEGGKE